MIKEYLESSYTDLFGNFPFVLDESGKILKAGTATEKEVRMLENLHKCALLSLACLKKSDGLIVRTKKLVACFSKKSGKGRNETESALIFFKSVVYL